MNIDAVSFLPAVQLPTLAPQALPAAKALSTAQATPAGGGFGNWFTTQLNQVNEQLLGADQGVRQLAVGDAANLHDVMIKLEEAKLSLQLMLQVRNNLLEAYQEIARMPL